MSVAEIKDELQRMSPAERREIARELAALHDGTDEAATPRLRTFEEAADYVFENYSDLLRRLAQ